MSDYARNLDTYNDGWGEEPDASGEECPICGAERDVWADGLVEMCGSCGDPAYELVDDETDMGDLMPYLVQTNPEYGLTWNDVDRALQLLTPSPTATAENDHA